MTEKTKKSLPFRRDLFLILLLLVLSLALLLSFFLTRREGEWVTVTVDGVTVGVYSLSVDGAYPLNGGTNLLIIEDGSARMEEANCPDATCVRTGRIRHTGERIVCLPNRITVTVMGKEDVDLTV